MAFSFDFAGDDIEVDQTSEQPAREATKPSLAAGAFPVAGKPQLPPAQHSLGTLIAQLPSKIAFSYLDIHFDDGDGQEPIRIPRRELWDVRVQLMAEDDGRGGLEGLGEHDVKTGVYEGGFKSWESSVDLVKTLAATRDSWSGRSQGLLRIIELGCGTALPSLAMFQWAIRAKAQQNECRHSFIVADYNPTVLQLVTLPNLILSWAVVEKSRVPALQDAFASDDELELTPEVLESFQSSLLEKQISLSFLSGAWSPELVDMIYEPSSTETTSTLTLLLGAETIYSPFALAAFTETMFSILERERKQGGNNQATAYIAAKRLYFGVGGSLDDFVHVAQSRGGLIDHLREETEGVRRGVVRCSLAGTENTT